MAIEPLAAPPDAVVTVPGSKSITNRALVTAALAEGRSVLAGALIADDTEAMTESLGRLGVVVTIDRATSTVTVEGTAGRVPPGPAEVDARLSGTTARFLLPLLALGHGRYRLDGAEPLRARPMGPLVDALRRLGAEVVDEGRPGHLPLTVVGDGRPGGAVVLPGDVSSQFLSGLLLSGPAMAGGLQVELSTPLVSRPYVELTAATMAAFGVHVERDDGRCFRVPPGCYRAARHRVEPDASAASYFFAAAALCGGRVRVPGLGRRSVQGDLRFVDVLERMGAAVHRYDDSTEVVGTGSLVGVDVDLSDCSDTAQTLAVVAVFASSPTRVRGIGFIRRKETDRIAAVVNELRRCGIDAEEADDGFLVRPGRARPTRVGTYGDHRMAMSFALLGLRVPGIEIVDPDCVAKTFPEFFTTLRQLRSEPAADAR
ncbi:MAG TPA: 3-phosphoshikimate 1-carboxyvinyltransferase [Acidimicrobiales bacterium]|nr:3-phosphoshikimate 1-carboxyvinyltransferase [Acidimicrobiales bacterium]